MTDYVKSTNFTSKDSLASGNPLKIIKGTEFDIEFNNIAVAVATKADIISPTFSGTPAAPTATAGTSTTQLATTAFVIAALQALHPIGSIYINAGVTTNPATLLGFGTWTAFGAGRVMVGLNGSDALFDALEETGGSKDATVVSHTHTFSASGTTDGGGAHSHTYDSSDGSGGGNTANTTYNLTGTKSTSAVGTHTHSFSTAGTTASTGSSATNANLQPYITVSMWKRTA